MTENKTTPSPEPRLMGYSLTSPSHGKNSRLGDQNDDRPKDSLACPRDGSCVCGNDHSTLVVWQLRHGGQDGHDWIYGDPARLAIGDFSSGAFSGSVLSFALLPRQNGDPVAYRHRLAGSSEWNVSNAGYMDGVRECMRHLGDQLEIEPRFAMEKLDGKSAGSRSMDEASLPSTSRLSQLEARTSCAASVNDQLTSPSPQPQNHALGSCDHRPHPPAPQNSDQQPDRHDHSKSTTTNWACDLAFGEQSEFRHQVAGNETDSKSDPEREKQHLVKVAQDGNEVRDEIDRRESVGSHAACDQLCSERGPLVLSGDPECDCIPLQGFRPVFQSLEPALHTSTYTVTAEETVKPTRAASPAPQTKSEAP